MSLRSDIQCLLPRYAEEIKEYGSVVLAINIPTLSEPFIYLERVRDPERYIEETLEGIEEKYPWGDAELDIEYTKRLYFYLDFINAFDCGESIRFLGKVVRDGKVSFVWDKVTVQEGDSPLDVLWRALFNSTYGSKNIWFEINI